MTTAHRTIADLYDEVARQHFSARLRGDDPLPARFLTVISRRFPGTGFDALIDAAAQAAAEATHGFAARLEDGAYWAILSADLPELPADLPAFTGQSLTVSKTPETALRHAVPAALAA